VVVPGAGAFTLRHGWTMGVCEDRSAGSTLSVGPMEPPEHRHPRWPFVPRMFVWPYHASAGASLRYVIWLMNVPPQGPPSKSATKRGTFRFRQPCPSYVERLTQEGKVVAKERYALNCDRVGPIPGNVAVAFAMRIPIPVGLTGKATLTWVLDPPYGFSRNARVVIAP